MNVSILLKRFMQMNLLVISMALVFTACGADDESEPVQEDPIVDDPVEQPDDDLLSYRGEWNGNLGFTGVPISAKVEEVTPGSFKGDLYITSSFISCCGSGDSDGEITFEVDGAVLSNFEWVDIIPGCEGTFTGDGTVNDDGDLEIDITGTDCDGDHVATISLRKL